MDLQNTVLLIKSLLNSFTKTEAKVADYVLANIENIIYMSVTELAEKADVGETTVLRFCRKLKFKGFQDFKITLARSTSQLSKPSSNIEDKDKAGIIKDKLIDSQIKVMEDMKSLLDSSKLEHAINCLVEATNIQFYGVGTSSLTASQGAHLFMRIGKSSDAKQDVHFQAMSTAFLNKSDVAIGLSVSGQTKDTVENLRLAKQSGATTICITSSARSPLTTVADIVLLTAAKENPLHGSSISSQIAQLIVLDILYMGILLKTPDKSMEFREKTARAVSEKLE